MLKEKNNYIQNKDFKVLLKEWLDSPKGTQMSNELAAYFMKMINKIANRSNFRNYSDLEDMKQTAFLNIILYGKNFNLERDNPFSYFTTMIFREFIKMINKDNERKNRMLRILYDSNNISDLKHFDFDNLKDD